MTEPSLERRYVNGAWRWVVREEPTGGSQPQPFNGYDRILFSQADGDEGSVWSMGADGRGRLQITPKVTGFYDYVASWEPTERKLVIYQHYDNDTGRYDIRTINTETGEILTLTTGFNPAPVQIPGGFLPIYSPDGAKIAFGSSPYVDSGPATSLWTMDADGANKTKIVDSADYHDGNVSADDRASWSPDGSRLAFSITDSATASDNGIWICDADGGNQTQVIDETSAGGRVISVAWSRHDVLAYTVNNSPWIHTINPDGTGETQIGTERGYFVNWSPDGTRLLVVLHNDAGGHNLILDLDGTVSRLPDTDTYNTFWGQNGDAPGWGSIAPVAAFVADGSTVDQLRDSLIAAGIVAPS